MMSGLNIRRMAEGDLSRLAEVETRCFTIPWSRSMLEEELANPNALYLVAEQDDMILGYAGSWLVFDEGHITNIAVEPSARRTGVGRTLLAALLEGMHGAGVRSATLEVRRGNAPAIALYQSFGFVVEGVRRGYYNDNNEDALIMWVQMTESGNGNQSRQGG